MAVSTVTASVADLPGAKVSELRMMLSTDANKDKRILLVEGLDDRKFYAHFVSHNHVVMNVLEGCYYMPQILTMTESLETLKDKVIGIKDADFDHIIGTKSTVSNLFVTDTHDWETMVMTEECENNVAIEALDRQETGLFIQVMNDLIDYSYVKLYNAVEVCGKNLDGIRFKGFTISTVYDGTNPCRKDVSLRELKNYGNNTSLGHFPTESDIDNLKLQFPSTNLYQLSCGHDVIHGVVCKLTHLKGCSPKIGYDAIEMLLRNSCTMDFFKTTQLYQTVANWAQERGAVIWAA